jgi:tRNA(fMet)-specific endonuclease VapC
VIGPEELVLLDTNVLLHLLRGSALGQKIEADFGLAKRPERPLISVVTVGEIFAIARRKSYSAEKRANLDELIRDTVVVDIRKPIADRYAEIQASQQGIDLPIGENDTWIAATAMATGSTLLTIDRDDFGKLKPGLIKLEIIDQPPKT